MNEFRAIAAPRPKPIVRKKREAWSPAMVRALPFPFSADPRPSSDSGLCVRRCRRVCDGAMPFVLHEPSVRR